MKTPKIIIINLICVVFALFHVFLQTEITKLGYQIKKNEDRFQELIEDNHILKYNVYTLESPYSLNKYALLDNSNLRILRPAQVFGLYPEFKPNLLKEDKNKNFLSKNPVFIALRRFFTGKQAEAKTIK
ncbi:hypothetical protein HQ550_05160 [bacterium]|nr:hypothetical protein [bacterium]